MRFDYVVGEGDFSQDLAPVHTQALVRDPLQPTAAIRRAVGAEVEVPGLPGLYYMPDAFRTPVNANLSLPILGRLARDAADDAAYGRRPLHVDGRFDVQVIKVATSKNMSTAEWPVFGAGEILDIDITFDRDIEVNGVPTLNLQGGGVASYTRGDAASL